MHLKRVEMENFKSFGRKLSIPFLDGFTAITGPNGSGKSNIGDAILFVLGPRSNKAIRAGKLTDLIFNGGKEKKPSNFCKVSLVFDNADRTIPIEEDEVSLTRLVKLSKNSPENYYSYFYVNGRPSSLGEFDTLLSHSRISADGYNITRQGDVTRIVEMTPLERRRIIDDIAGITKFDNDIHKANNEKEQVEQNLDRIRIILQEIDAQLLTLEREKERALQYKELKDELDLTKAKHARRRHDNLQQDLAGAHQTIASAEEDKQKLEDALGNLQDELRGLEQKLTDIENKIADRGGEEAKEIREKIDALKGETIRATERLNHAKNEIGDLKHDRAAYEGDLKRLLKELEKQEKAKATVLSGKAGVDEELATHQAELDGIRDAIAKSTGKAGDLQRELAELKIQYEKAQDHLGDARVERGVLEDKEERLKQLVAELGEQVETAGFELKDVEWDLKELTKETESSSQDIEGRKKDLFSLKKRESELSKQLMDLEPAIRRLQNDYARLKAERDANEAVSKGYSRAVDAIITARDQGRLKGVCGTIAELARVDKKYETAMEIAAGGRMQAIVTETDADAAQAIEFLKRNKLGRATFLPLNKMVPGRPAGKPLMAVRDADAEGFAIDLIEFDDEYRPAFWYVFRDTVVVKHLTAARKLMGGVRLVTLDGDVIDAGGAMTGGESAARANKMRFGGASQADLDKIAKDLRGAVASQETLSDELMTVRSQISEIETVLREGTSMTSEKADRIVQLKKRQAEFQKKHQELQKERDAREEELAKVAGSLETEVAKIEEMKAKLEAFEEEREEKNKLLLASTSKDLAEKTLKLTHLVENLREQSRDFQGQVDTKAREIALLEERRSELEAKIAQIEEKMGEHEAAMEECAGIVEEKERELQVLLKLESEQNEELKGLHKERDQVWEARSEMQQRIAKLHDKIETANDLILHQKARIPALEDAVREVAEELTLFPDAPEEVTESLEELRAHLRKLEAKLDSLGNVNMLALEEYDRQAERKGELSVEVEKLEGQRENLVNLVDEITAKKKTEFYKVYDEINKNFQTVFARLSDGGKAELILENPEMPFDGGLTMKAQPKGKKVTRLEALSGGEKSLTSMAFIFAIQEYDPSPFYYLDEVDQNLDGINSELLARLVRVNSKTAQCIVVSLRKVTLKEADHVYGVTMLDSGLSEVVGEVRVSEIVDEPAPSEAGASPPGGAREIIHQEEVQH